MIQNLNWGLLSLSLQNDVNVPVSWTEYASYNKEWRAAAVTSWLLLTCLSNCCDASFY